MSILIFVLTSFITGATMDNPSGGIYLNDEHFRRHTLSYPFDCHSSADKHQLNNFLGGPSIRITHQGVKQTLQKDQIFGYHDCNGADYRFYQHSPYHILDTAHFYLYSLERLVQGSKIARPGTEYFFSIDATSRPLPLTIANLEKAFASHRDFCYRLHTDFRSDADLIAYIPSLGTYKLKYAYGG